MLKDLFRKLRPPASGPRHVERQAESLIAQGNALEDAGHVPQACDLYAQAVALSPDLPAAHLNLGLGLAAAGDAAGARRAYETLLSLQPGHAFGCYNYAALCYSLGERDRAGELVRRALHTKPDLHQGHLLLSNILDDSGQLDAAIHSAQQALQHCPTYAGAHYNLALMLQKAGRLEDALAEAERALALDASGTERRTLAATLLASNGLVEEALELHQTARRMGSFDAGRSAAQELFFLNFNEAADPVSTFALHREHGQRLEAAAPFVYSHPQSRVAPDDHRLRIGFVSGDLRVHPVALFLLPLLQRYDRQRLHVTCYSSGDIQDHVTERLRVLVDEWNEVQHLSDADLAQKVHVDGVEILVDLSGYSGAIRAATFAQKPAPVQCSWLGYLNTTGLSRMDYRVTDMRADPPEMAQRLHQEKLAYLPHSQWCYRPFLEVTPAALGPAEANGFITFGSYNQAGKITARQCRRWAEILQAVPRSRLLIADVSSNRKRSAILKVMQEAGVAADRLEFLPRVDLEAYYRSFERADIALDTFPYTGGTTTFDALAHGVPVVTAVGPTSFSRSAGSILAGLGLDDWIAPTIDRYVDLAIARAADRHALAGLRRELPRRLAASAFMDETRFAADVQNLLKRMWSDHCDPQ